MDTLTSGIGGSYALRLYRIAMTLIKARFAEFRLNISEEKSSIINLKK